MYFKQAGRVFAETHGSCVYTNSGRLKARIETKKAPEGAFFVSIARNRGRIGKANSPRTLK